LKVEDIIAEKMNSRVQRQIISSSDFSELLSKSDYNGAVIGNGSLYSPRHNTSYVLQTETVGGYPLTAPALARAIIEKKLAALGRKTYPKPKDWKQWQLHSHPLYCKPCEGEFVYLDISNCFFSLYTKLPALPQGTAHSMNCAPPWMAAYLPEDLEDWKLIRNCLVGLWRSNSVVRLRDGQFKKKTQYFPTTNYYAWQWIQKALHYFANLALEHEAVYIVRFAPLARMPSKIFLPRGIANVGQWTI